MTLLERIEADYITAAKSREHDTVGTLRMLKSALKNEAIKIKDLHYVLSDVEAMTVLSREVKQRHDAAEQYSQGKRPDLAEKELKEIAIIERYLPEALSEGEIHDLVTIIIEEAGATSRADMGKVMAELKNRLENPTDVARAAKVVQEKLA